MPAYCRPLRTEQVKAQIQAMLANYPELRDDDEDLVLSLESETDAMVLCERLVKATKETEAQSDAIAHYISELRIRQEFLDLRAEKMREALLSIMQATDLNKLPLAIATLSLRYNQHVTVTDRDLIPDNFRRQPPWEPLKNLIKETIKSGGDVPGCALSNPEPSLTIRVK